MAKAPTLEIPMINLHREKLKITVVTYDEITRFLFSVFRK